MIAREWRGTIRAEHVAPSTITHYDIAPEPTGDS